MNKHGEDVDEGLFKNTVNLLLLPIFDYKRRRGWMGIVINTVRSLPSSSYINKEDGAGGTMLLKTVFSLPTLFLNKPKGERNDRLYKN